MKEKLTRKGSNLQICQKLASIHYLVVDSSLEKVYFAQELDKLTAASIDR
jgi:hypothetical protein